MQRQNDRATVSAVLPSGRWSTLLLAGAETCSTDSVCLQGLPAALGFQPTDRLALQANFLGAETSSARTPHLIHLCSQVPRVAAGTFYQMPPGIPAKALSARSPAWCRPPTASTTLLNPCHACAGACVRSLRFSPRPACPLTVCSAPISCCCSPTMAWLHVTCSQAATSAAVSARAHALLAPGRQLAACTTPTKAACMASSLSGSCSCRRRSQ